jgi:hypothetical protein
MTDNSKGKQRDGQQQEQKQKGRQQQGQTKGWTTAGTKTKASAREEGSYRVGGVGGWCVSML